MVISDEHASRVLQTGGTVARRPLVEVCVGEIGGALAVESAGADRIELCADLGEGGFTPSLGTVTVTLARLRRTAVRIMVRPRGGDFIASEAEVAVMLADLQAIKGVPNPHGLEVGVVVGPLDVGGEIDRSLLTRLVEAADPLPVTFHKAFDEVPDQLGSLEVLIEAGVTSLLTSGGAPTALDGAAKLRALHERASGRLEITVAGGIREHNLREVLAAVRPGAVHLRAPIRRGGREASDPTLVRRVLALARADVAAV
ncbi:MAG: copper homeostasis protein CutC [Humibacillus sp.]|nr:copper homeostasis protein CutC [Humibacillus sp.]MDN5778584.1 copper homeostasis protein CutC [Humibacillus sp.]